MVSRGGEMKIKLRWASSILSMFLIAACANPLNQVTADRYGDTCAQAEQNGRLDVAEEACRRALINVDVGNLNEIQKSQKLYNLGRIKRQLRKFEEAENLLKMALEIEEKQNPVSADRIGRRLAEISMVYGEQLRFEEGLPYVEKLLPLADSYTGNERQTVAVIFGVYSEELKKSKRADSANKLAKKAADMGFDPKQLKK
jgi:tetratricopeptide (TPR) repeat protein